MEAYARFGADIFGDPIKIGHITITKYALAELTDGWHVESSDWLIFMKSIWTENEDFVFTDVEIVVEHLSGDPTDDLIWLKLRT